MSGERCSDVAEIVNLLIDQEGEERAVAFEGGDVTVIKYKETSSMAASRPNNGAPSTAHHPARA